MAEIGTAYVSILASAKGMGKSITSQVGGEVDGAGKKVGSSFGNAIKAGAVAALAGAAILGKFLKGSLDEAREAQVVTARTENVIAKMGNAAGISAGQVAKLAGSISAKTGIDDEAIQSGQNLLLTFGNIRNEAGKGNDIFNQTSKLMVDLSAAMGTDAKGSAIQLGKALNDPVKGISALTRVGVSFTEGQKAQIESMVAAGNTMGAQKVILGELERQFGGAAAAMATPADKARVAFDNLKEQIGTALLPVVDRLLTVFTTQIVPAISAFIMQVQTGVGAGGAFADAFMLVANNLGTIAPVLGVVVAGLAAYRIASLAAAAATVIQAAGTTAATGATWSLNAALRANPIGLVVTALTLLVAGLVIAYKKSETFRNIVNAVWNALRVAAGWVSDLAGRLSGQLVGAVVAVIGAVQNMVGWVRDKASAAWGALKDKAVSAAQAIIGPVQNVVDKVQALVTFLENKALTAWGTLKEKAVSAFNAILGPIQSVVSVVQSAIDKVQGLIDKIQSIPGIPGGGGGNIPFVPFLAKGTNFHQGGLAVVGERGPELVNLPRGSQVIPNHRAFGSGGNDAVLAELRAIRAAVGSQGREFGREINGAAKAGQRGRVA